MKLTITLPSIREHAVARALENVRDATRCDHEVVVVSPLEPPDVGGSITWVRDTLLSGGNAGHAQALTYARGDLIFPWVDDHFLADGWDEQVLAEFAEREDHHRPLVMGVRNAPHVGTVFGIYYPYFPLMRLATARLGFWFDPEYQCGFADADLGLRAWDRGLVCEWSSKIVVQPHPDDDRKGPEPHTTAADTARFLDRWKPVFGREHPTDRVRDFNKDVVPTGAARTFSPGMRYW